VYRHYLLIAAAALAVSCGSDSGPTDPSAQRVRIDLTIDWPLAREDGFVNAHWTLTKVMDTQHDNVVVKQGNFSRDGTARVTYTTTCYSEFSSKGHYIGLFGRFEGADEQCAMGPGPHYCTSEPQTVVVPAVTRAGCQPPSD